MAILLTGGTGELGALLVEHLLGDGREVRILSRQPFLASEKFEGKAQVWEWHPGVDAVPLEALAGVTTVMHLLGEPLTGRIDQEKLQRIETSRCAATQRLIDGFGGRPWRLIVASVVSASQKPDAVLTEASPRDGTMVAAAQSLLAAETAAHAARSAGASVAIVRLGLLLSQQGAIGCLARLARRGLVANFAQSAIPAIDVRDAAAMLAGLVERPDIEGPINAVAPEPLKGAELTRLLTHCCPWPARMPAPRRIVARDLGLLMPLLENRARVIPQRLSELGARYQYPDPGLCLEPIIAALAAHPPPWQAWRPVLARSPNGCT